MKTRKTGGGLAPENHTTDGESMLNLHLSIPTYLRVNTGLL